MLYLDRNLYTRNEAIDDDHQSVDRETVQVGVSDAGEIGRGYAGLGVCGTHGQVPSVEGLDDLSCQERLEMPHVGIGVAEVAENVAAAVNEFNGVFFHVSEYLASIFSGRHGLPLVHSPVVRRRPYGMRHL